MSKELEAFETVKMEIIASKGEDFQLEFDEELYQSLEIIETALKRLESIEDTRFIILGGRCSGKTQKVYTLLKLKAFEIIKEKRVNVNQFFKHCSNNDKWGYNKTVCDKKRQLTQEEYDLLKKVLL